MGNIMDPLLQYNKNGFDTEFTNHNVNIIEDKYTQSQLQSDSTLTEYGTDEKIKQLLVNKLVQNLYNSKHIEFIKAKHPNNLDTTYKARIHVLDKKFSNIMIQDSSYYLDNIEFKEDEIKEAIKNTYPERLL